MSPRRADAGGTAREVTKFWQNLRGKWRTAKTWHRVERPRRGVASIRTAGIPSGIEAYRSMMWHDGLMPSRAKSYKLLIRAACKAFDALIEREKAMGKGGRPKGRRDSYARTPRVERAVA